MSPFGNRLNTLASRLGIRSSSQSLPIVDLPFDVETVYAIGDVHGYLDALVALEARIEMDARARPGRSLIVMLGDYIDRGPDSAHVLDHLSAVSLTVDRLCLRGNHEQLMLDFLARPTPGHPWLRLGGLQTLTSYGLSATDFSPSARRTKEWMRQILDTAIPAQHRTFLDAMPIAMRSVHFIFVHAGVRPGIELARQSDYDLLWIREPFLSDGPGLKQTVVHGHTEQSTLQFTNGRLGIDLGVYRTGVLTAVRIARDGIFSIASAP